MSSNPYLAVKRIAFELSNRCVHAHEHLLCPAHMKMVEPPANLASRHVVGVLDAFRVNAPAFAGFIYFHLYNEPLADPRLLGFVATARKTLPRAIIQITTSGWNLDQTLLDELATAGARAVRVSIYDKATLTRVGLLRPRGVKLIHGAKAPADWRGTLRKDIPSVYGDGPAPAADGKCPAPYGQLCIAATADVCLCCMDWKRTVTFGNLNSEPLDAILRSEKMRAAAGARPFDVCKRCLHRTSRRSG